MMASRAYSTKNTHAEYEVMGPPEHEEEVQQHVYDLYLTANWPAILFFFSTLFTTPHRPPSRELVSKKSSLQCFYVNNCRHILDRHSSVTLVVACVPGVLCTGNHLQQHHAHFALFRVLCLQATWSGRNAEPDAT